MSRKKPAPRSKKKAPAPTPATPKDIIPAGYALSLEQLKTHIRLAQLKAAAAVNRELIELYWDIGKQIVERRQAESWGRSVVDRLARDLQREFPSVYGFSPSNIWRMPVFYLAYTEGVTNLAQSVREMDGISLPGPMPGKGVRNLLRPQKDPDAFLSQAVREFDTRSLP